MTRKVRLRKNPGAHDLPYDEWIPAHAVKFKEDGTVSLMTERSANTGNRQRNAKAELLGKLHGFDYWRLGDEVYRSHPESGGYITTQGLPSDVRWESNYEQFLHYIKPQMGNPRRRR